MKAKFITMILLGVLSTNVCTGQENVTQISRYMTVKNKARPEQINLMLQIVQVRFPQDVRTIGNAINYLLRFSGYSLIPTKRMNPGLRITLSKPLPLVDREIGPISLKEALSVLVGQGFNLVFDPINREVDFKLKENYQKFVNRGQV